MDFYYHGDSLIGTSMMKIICKKPKRISYFLLLFSILLYLINAFKLSNASSALILKSKSFLRSIDFT